jgi:nucleotide-binding universal stress UspA family protein
MYKHILVAIENSDADRTILDHVVPLALMTGADLVLVHVADGWAARNYDELQLRESEEMREDRAYLEQLREELTGKGLVVKTKLAAGDPAKELIKAVDDEGADLIALATHGHGFINDLVRGQTVNHVRHVVKVPVLLLKAHPH